MTGGPSFSRLNNVTLRVCVCVAPCLWSVRGHLGCFHVSAVVNNECTVIHIFCMYLLGSLILFPLDRYPVMELTGRMAVLSLLFEEPPCRFPPVYVPAQGHRAPFLMASPAHSPVSSAMAFLTGVRWCFPDDEWRWASFLSYTCWSSVRLLWQMFNWVLCPFLNRIVWFFDTELYESFMYFWILAANQRCDL